MITINGCGYTIIQESKIAPEENRQKATQPNFTQSSLSKCLSFPIHIFKIIQRNKRTPGDLIVPSSTVIYSDTDNRVKLIFGHHDVTLFPFSGKPDSIFINAGRDIIRCTMDNNDSALKWFCYYSFKMDSVLETRKAFATEVFGNVEIFISIDSKEHSIATRFSQYPEIHEGMTR
jgi:hypothetical protein